VPDDTVNTTNDFLFGGNGSSLQPMLLPVITTQQQAFRTAAWLLAMACVLPEEDPATPFPVVRKAIENT